MQGFARLQQRFGRWGLAWLESLLRCADALGSQPADSGATAATPGDSSISPSATDGPRDGGLP